MQRFDWTRKREINDQVFFVMGFIDGASVAEKLAAGPLPRATRCPFAT